MHPATAVGQSLQACCLTSWTHKPPPPYWAQMLGKISPFLSHLSLRWLGVTAAKANWAPKEWVSKEPCKSTVQRTTLERQMLPAPQIAKSFAVISTCCSANDPIQVEQGRAWRMWLLHYWAEEFTENWKYHTAGAPNWQWFKCSNGVLTQILLQESALAFLFFLSWHSC